MIQTLPELFSSTVVVDGIRMDILAVPDDSTEDESSVIAKAFSAVFKDGSNCGTGDGGFKPGNTCGKKDGKGGGLKTDSPGFRAWFGDSKIVDDDGKPLVLYHGSGADFSEFDPYRGVANGRQHGAGIYLTPSAWRADGYANRVTDGRDAGSVYAVYVSAQNVIEIDGELTPEQVEAISAQVEGENAEPTYHGSRRKTVRFSNEDKEKAHKLFDDAAEDWEKNGEGYDRYYPSADRDKATGEWIVEYNDPNSVGVMSDVRSAISQLRNLYGDGYGQVLARAGIDAVRYGDEYVVQDPRKIKSAIGNSGEYDSESSDIRKAFVSVFVKADKDWDKCDWKTMNGTPVCIDDAGTVQAGPEKVRERFGSPVAERGKPTGASQSNGGTSARSAGSDRKISEVRDRAKKKIAEVDSNQGWSQGLKDKFKKEIHDDAVSQLERLGGGVEDLADREVEEPRKPANTSRNDSRGSGGEKTEQSFSGLNDAARNLGRAALESGDVDGRQLEQALAGLNDAARNIGRGEPGKPVDVPREATREPGKSEVIDQKISDVRDNAKKQLAEIDANKYWDDASKEKFKKEAYDAALSRMVSLAEEKAGIPEEEPVASESQEETVVEDPGVGDQFNRIAEQHAADAADRLRGDDSGGFMDSVRNAMGAFGDKVKSWFEDDDPEIAQFKEKILSAEQASPGADDAVIEEHRAVFRSAVDRLPRGMLKAVSQGVDAVHYYETPKEISVARNSGNKNYSVYGFYRPAKRSLHLDGGPSNMSEKGNDVTQHGIYVHELAHAADHSDPKNVFSKSSEWMEAFSQEIDTEDEDGTARLTQYARKKPSEGFAEFMRLWSSSPDVAQSQFPRCFDAVRGRFGDF